MKASDEMESEKKILIIEDSSTQALKLKLVLEEHGYSVILAKNGREGLDILRRVFCQIVITDWVMPEMNGVEFCRVLRATTDLPGYVYVILLTARKNLDDLVTAFDAGADDYLTKPVHPAELMARLKTALRIINLEKSLKQRNEEIARLAIMDSLTGLFNRRYFNENLPKALMAAKRRKQPIGLIIADIDHFKMVNDTYGHQAGDRVLQQFAKLISSSLRTGLDWVARYGGEEFAIILPETDLVGAHTAAERLRLVIAHTPFDIGAEQELRITASFGVASVRPAEQAITMEQFVDIADSALYKAKNLGRNRVEAAEIA